MGGLDYKLRPPKADDKTPHFGSEGAEVLKKTVFLDPKGLFERKKAKIGLF